MPTSDPNTWAYHPDFADLVRSKDSRAALRLLAAADIALSFARALVAKQYEEAANMLADSLKPSCPPEFLCKELEEMIWLERGGDRWPTAVMVVTATDSSDMAQWKRKTADDFGWVYVAINGADYCEAVSVVIATDGPRLAIREIEWGRP